MAPAASAVLLVRAARLVGLGVIVTVVVLTEAAQAGPTTTSTTIPPTTTTTTSQQPTVTVHVGADPVVLMRPPAGAHAGEVCSAPLWVPDGVPGYFVVERSDTDGALDVTYSVGGTTTAGVGYAPLAGIVTFAPGEGVVRIPVVPLERPVAVNGLPLGVYQTVTIAVTPGSAYVIGDSGEASAWIGLDAEVVSCVPAGFGAVSDLFTDPAALGALPRTGPSSELLLAAVGVVLLCLGVSILAVSRRLARR